jgi:hypothetical protein
VSPSPSGSADEHYVSISDACERLGLSRSAVFILIRQHGLKKYRRPRDPRTYVRIDDLELASRRMPSQRRELIRVDDGR